MDALELDAICRNHVEGAQRRWPEACSLCRECEQVWPCDASRLATELVLSDGAVSSLPPGTFAVLRFNPGRLTTGRAHGLRDALRARRPDIEWLVLEADDLVSFAPPSEVSRNADRSEVEEAGEEGREEDPGPEGP